MKRNVNKQQPSQNSVTAAAAVAPPVEAIEAVEVERVPNPNMSLEAAVNKPPPKPEATPMPEGKLLTQEYSDPNVNSPFKFFFKFLGSLFLLLWEVPI